MKEGNKVLIWTNFRVSQVQEIIQNKPVREGTEKKADSDNLENETVVKLETILNDFVFFVFFKCSYSDHFSFSFFFCTKETMSFSRVSLGSNLIQAFYLLTIFFGKIRIINPHCFFSTALLGILVHMHILNSELSEALRHKYITGKLSPQSK